MALEQNSNRLDSLDNNNFKQLLEKLNDSVLDKSNEFSKEDYTRAINELNLIANESERIILWETIKGFEWLHKESTLEDLSKQLKEAKNKIKIDKKFQDNEEIITWDFEAKVQKSKRKAGRNVEINSFALMNQIKEVFPSTIAIQLNNLINFLIKKSNIEQ